MVISHFWSNYDNYMLANDIRKKSIAMEHIKLNLWSILSVQTAQEVLTLKTVNLEEMGVY